MSRNTTAIRHQKQQLPPTSNWAPKQQQPPTTTSGTQSPTSATPPINGRPPNHSRSASRHASTSDGVAFSSNRNSAVFPPSGSNMTFGSVSETPADPAPAPLANGDVTASSSSTVPDITATPPPAEVAPAGPIKTFGSVPTASTTPPVAASPTPSNASAVTGRRRLDPHKMFQTQSSGPPAPQTDTSTPTFTPASAIPPSSFAPQGPYPIPASPAGRFNNLPYSPQIQNAQLRPGPGPAPPPNQNNNNQRGGVPQSPSFTRNQMLPVNGAQGPMPRSQPPAGIPGSPRIGVSVPMGQQPPAQQMPASGPPQPPPPQPQPGQYGMAPQPQWPPGQGYWPGQGYPYPYMPQEGGWYPAPQMHHPMHPHAHHPSPYLQTPTTPLQSFGSPQIAPSQILPAISPRVGPMSNLPPQSPAVPPAAAPINTNIMPTGSTPKTPLTAGAREFVPGGSGFVTPQPPVFTPQQPSVVSSQAGFPLPKRKTIKITNASGEAVTFPDAHARTVSISSPALAEGKKPIRMENPVDKEKREAAEKAAKDEEERVKKEAEERVKREEEEAKRKIEEEERAKKEAEERAIHEEEERKKKEEDDRLEAERLKKEEEERLKHEEEARIQKEKEEAEAKIKAEDERLRKEKEAEEAAAAIAVAAAVAAKEKEQQDKDRISALKDTPSTSASASPVPSPSPLPSKPSLAPITTSTPDRSKLGRPVPGPLNLQSVQVQGIVPSLPSALSSARKIEDLESVNYPDGLRTPLEMNQGATKGGKFKYDRDFLLQFMGVCKDKPDNLASLNELGIEKDGDGMPTTGPPFGAGRGGRSRMGSMGPPSATGRTPSVGLGFGFPGKNNPFGSGMGQFQTTPRVASSSEDRFAASVRAASTSGSFAPGRGAVPMARSSSQGGVGGHPNAVPPSPGGAGRTRSQRGRQRIDSIKGGGNPQAYNQQQQPQVNYQGNAMGFEPIAPLQASENRWTPASRARAQVDENAPEVVERKVKALLNKLTLEKFDSISDQIITWANKSENESNGATLIHVIKLVFEKATDEATWSEMYARLCRKMMEQISMEVQDEGVKNNEGKPIVGGHLFRKYLLNRCQEDFERGWSAKEAAAAAALLKAADDQAAAAAHAASGDKDEVVLYSDEYYIALKAKRQGLGLVKFIGELFKLQMLTERIMHECIKKLLSKVDDPEEEEIESLCKLLTTVGQSLDIPKAKNHMDIYFARMDTIAKNPAVANRVRYMLIDVIELRQRHWQHRATTAAAPTTLAQVHEQAAKEKAEASRLSMSRTASRRGEHGGRGDNFAQQGADGWNVAGGPPRPPTKAGDMTHFGKFNKPATTPMLSMGPSSVFGKKGDKGRDTPPPSSLSRAASSGNMFHILGNGAEAATPEILQRTPSNRGGNRKTSIADPNAVPDTPMRKKLALLPRSQPTATEKAAEEGGDDRSDAGTELDPANAEVAPSMTDEEANIKVKEDVKEFFSVRSVSEAEDCFQTLPEVHRSKLVDKMVTKALDGKEGDVKLAADLFAQVAGKCCSPDSFEAGFSGLMEFLDDMAVDVPQAYPFMARLLHASKLPRETVEVLAGKILADGEPLVTPKDKLLKAFDGIA